LMIFSTRGKMLHVGVRLVPYGLQEDEGIWRLSEASAVGWQAEGEQGEVPKGGLKRVGTNLRGPPPPSPGAEADERLFF
jgi:hypothetical protein